MEEKMMETKKTEENSEVQDSVSVQNKRTAERKKMEEREALEFRILAPASLVYALIFAFCLYDNFAGITSAVCAAATVAYIIYVAKKYSKKWSGINTFISAAIFLLGCSNFITGKELIIFFNYIAIICLIIVNMMFLFFDTRKMNVTKHIMFIITLVGGVISQFGAPFRQGGYFIKNKKTGNYKKLLYVLIGIFITIPLISFVTILLAKADGVFREVLGEFEKLFVNNIFSDNIFGILVMIMVGFISSYAFSIYFNMAKLNLKEGKSAENEPIVAIVVTSAISVIYVLFSAIQVIYLFMGKGELPEGYSYARYAREGFFQLLFISILNLIIVLVCIEFFRDNKILKILMMIINVCTFVMIASSAYRMGMYIKEYGLTFTRVLVLWALTVITIIMLGLCIQIFKPKFNLFRYSIAVITICFMILSFSHIDYFIAKYDLDMYQQADNSKYNSEYSGDGGYNYRADYDYLLELSSDAAPAFAEHKEEMSLYLKNNYNKYMELKDTYWAEKCYEEYSIRKFNLSKYIARLCIEKF